MMQQAFLPKDAIHIERPAAAEQRPLWRLYDQAYEVSPACTRETSVEAFALRYQVYCLEKGFEDPAVNPLGLECDAFDGRSLHCLLRHRETGIPVGTARLIRPNPLKLGASWPIQQICRDPRLFDEDLLPAASTAEVSRFCLSTAARARIQAACRRSADTDETEGRLAPYTILGLIRGLLMLSLEQGITHWTLVVEPALLRLLGRMGMQFTKLGPIVEYHGRRQPCCTEIAALLQGMRAKRRDLWNIVTDRGSLSPETATDSAGVGGFWRDLAGGPAATRGVALA
ncbi:MAG: PEP-CTERM/exosortase system-associated acyltransferase [Tistlia sp.]|uniref:PEP-CTERM/exosortase system-associated acyltransferase n=1 Tax=Tistlia sp. TaxID=3057121 RepID=UPI0034A251E2